MYGLSDHDLMFSQEDEDEMPLENENGATEYIEHRLALKPPLSSLENRASASYSSSKIARV